MGQDSAGDVGYPYTVEPCLHSSRNHGRGKREAMRLVEDINNLSYPETTQTAERQGHFSLSTAIWVIGTDRVQLATKLEEKSDTNFTKL